MEKIERSALLPYSAEKMYQLVNDIEKYPAFVPFCKKANIDDRSDESISATLLISKSGIAKSFTTLNTLSPYKEISMQLIDGPFKKLNGYWRFKSLSDNACKIELSLEYEFSNKLTSLAFTKIFNQLAQSMVTAFTQRANEVY